MTSAARPAASGIVIVRHGRTDANAAGLLLGRADPPLDPHGEHQASRIAESLTRSDRPPVARIISSPLRRTAQTAERIGAATGINVDFDDRFLELDYGAWDRRPVADVSTSEWSAWRSDPNFAPPDGESIAALGVRVRAGLDDLADSATEDGITVVVSHVSPIKAAVVWALGGDDAMAWRLFVAQASITEIAVSGGHRSLRVFNDSSHLAATTAPLDDRRERRRT